MTTAEPADSAEPDDAHLGNRNIWFLPIVAGVAGIIIGIIGGGFRWLLVKLDALRVDIADWSHTVTGIGWAIPVLLSAAAAVAAGLIAKYVPLSGGSGIQHVEAVDRGDVGAEPPPLRVLPARFVGGLLSIGVGGLVLGREGPTVHMGATIGAQLGRWARATADELRRLQTILAGAGLAVAFNAPVGGALFSFEEVSKKFQVRDALPMMLAVVTAVAGTRVILGNHPDFEVAHLTTMPLELLPIFALFGLIVGALGSAYAWVGMQCINLYDRLAKVPATVKAAVVGAFIGACMFLDPNLVGGGDAISQLAVSGHTFALPMLLLYLVVRFFTGPISYAIGTPGGLFAPMLAVGALMGVLYAEAVTAIWPAAPADFGVTVAIVGMSTLFAAVVRAPFTGIVLIMEMTASTEVLLPMLMAVGISTLVASALHTPPIYDSLRLRMERQWAQQESR